MTTTHFELIADVINESRVCFEDKDDATRRTEVIRKHALAQRA